MKRCWSLFPFLFLLGACATPRMSVTPRFGTFDVSGDFGVSTGGVVATNDLENMGIDKDSGVVGGRFDFKWGVPHLSVSTQSSSHGGRGTLANSLDFGGGTIDPGPVDTQLDLGLHNATLTFDLAPTDYLELGLGFGVTALGVDLTVTDIGTGQVYNTDETVPIPVLAGRVAGHVDRFEAAALLSGFSLSAGGDEVSFFDLDLFGRYRLFGGQDHIRGSILLGYRSVSFDLEYEDGADNADVELDMAGPYLGLQFTL